MHHCRTLVCRRSNILLKLSFALSFMYTRFCIGGIRLADPDFVWANAGDMPEYLIKYGWACLLVIHGCACFWGGQLVLQLMRSMRSAAFRTKFEPLAAVPGAIVGLCCGSVPVAMVVCALAVATFKARCGGRSGKPWLDPDGRPRLLPRPWRALEIALTLGSSLVLLEEANGEGARTLGWPFLSLFHVTALMSIMTMDRMFHPREEIAAALTWMIVLTVTAVDTFAVRERPRIHTVTLLTMFVLCASILYQLKRQSALEYAPILMHVMGAVFVFQGCHCVPGPSVAQLVQGVVWAR
mmetsp:Transcript_14714/g.44907  ORF Transcript_14714/g.44907 Transcript_14714/m.44907 type:complete len:296 (-) Transcript_14714:191-1078(-)